MTEPKISSSAARRQRKASLVQFQAQKIASLTARLDAAMKLILEASLGQPDPLALATECAFCKKPLDDDDRDEQQIDMHVLCADQHNREMAADYADHAYDRYKDALAEEHHKEDEGHA